MANLPSILMLTHGLGLEGAPRCLVNVARGIAQNRQWHVTVFSHVDGPLRAELEEVGIDVLVPKLGTVPPLFPGATDLERYCRGNMRFLDLSSKATFAESVSSIGEYISRTTGFVPNIILANTILGFWGIELAHMWNIPSIWCIHESEPPFSHLEWLSDDIFAALPESLASASKVVFVAKATQEVFTSAGYTCNSIVIPNALPRNMPVFSSQAMNRSETRSTLGIIDDDICFLVLGSVFERKGQTDICNALSLLPEKLLARVRCLIVGDRPGTPYSRVLHDCIRTLSLKARNTINVYPETQDTAPYYRAADVFAFCSRIESYPLVILEAMAIGLPIITTPVFGIREQLTDCAALFYEPGDLTTLATHMTTLVQNSTMRATLGAKALHCFSRLSDHEDMVAAYHTIFMKCFQKSAISEHVLLNSKKIID